MDRISMERNQKYPRKRTPLSPSAVLAIGFFLIITAGTLLLMLPAASKSGEGVGWLTALFTATSATCVTGLTLVDTYTAFTLFGQIVIISLIQVGGLGFMLFATMLLVALRRRVSLHSRMLLRDSMSMPGLSGGVRTSKRFVALAFGIELAGALVLSTRFIPEYGVGRGLYYGLFHSISAFCNAGFDLFGPVGSLVGHRDSAVVLMTISFLIILGGIGFAVIWDVIDHFRTRKPLMLHTKVVLIVTGALLVAGTVFIAAVEWNNPLTLAREGAGTGERLMNAWFQSVTPRTAGYFSFPQAPMEDASKMISAVLMFIGASPASTGGGIKTSTFLTAILVLAAIVLNREDTTIFGRRIPSNIGRTAQSILFIYLALLVLGMVLMPLFEEGKGFSMMDLLFEETSALATVGLTAVGTANLSTPSKLWLVLLMYFGRVGPLTMMLSFSRPSPVRPGAIRYPEEQLLVG